MHINVSYRKNIFSLLKIKITVFLKKNYYCQQSPRPVITAYIFICLLIGIYTLQTRTRLVYNSLYYRNTLLIEQSIEHNLGRYVTYQHKTLGYQFEISFLTCPLSLISLGDCSSTSGWDLVEIPGKHVYIPK